ncbi:hypothetical protein TFLX_06201 [Thermoflexales bacterium]|nr:hypothetical protein TFLX_06201 [Thermoflexales bacterium]
MKPNKSLKPFLLGGSIALGYAFLRQVLNWNLDSAGDLLARTETTRVHHGQAEFDLPIAYYRDDCFVGVFDAAYQPVAQALPTGLYPVTLFKGRCAIAIIAFNYLRTSIGPYGEIGITIPCTRHPQSLPLLPLLLESKFPALGMFILHLPVTTLIARDAGRGVWGYTKFVADMDFEKLPTRQQVRLAEGNTSILTLTIAQKGLPLPDNRPLVTYSVLDKHLIKTTIPTRAVYQLGLGGKYGQLELGDHPIAEQLKSFEISTSPTFTKNYLSRASLLPAGETVTSVECSPLGYAGVIQGDGRLTMSP